MTDTPVPVGIVEAEGDTDRVVIERLLKGQGFDVYPKPGARRVKGDGNSSAIKATIERLRAQQARLVLALDINGGTAAELLQRVEQEIRKYLSEEESKSFEGGNGIYKFEKSQLHVWPMGLPDDPVLRELGIQRHAVDDFLLKALLDRECLGKLEKSEDKVFIPPNADPWATARRLIEAARTDNFELVSSKRVLHLFQALIGFGASSATLATCVIKHAAGTPADRVFDLPAGFTIPPG